MMRDKERFTTLADSITLVFVDGAYDNTLSDTRLLASEMLHHAAESGEMTLTLPKNFSVPAPIHLLFTGSSTSSSSGRRHVIVANENSDVVLFEEHTTSQPVPVATDVYVEKNARVQYYKIQHTHSGAIHTARFQQKQDSQVSIYLLSTQTTQEDIRVQLMERGAECELHGLYSLNQDKQDARYALHIDHLASHTVSAMHFKGVLAKKSRAAFTGKVHVHQNAQHISAQQQNHNLLLTTDAEVSTKPELEIYADDVKCAHGATVGQLDDDALFYLRSRGIEQQEAKKILTQAFAAEIFSSMKHALIKHYIKEKVEHHESV